MARTTTGVAQQSTARSLLENLLMPSDPRALERRSELVGVIVVALATTFGAALWSYEAADMDVLYSGKGGEGVANLIGPVGARVADLLLQLFGVFAYAFDGLLLVVGLRTLIGKSVVPRLGTFSGVSGALIGTMLLVHLWARAIELRPHGKDAAGLFGSAAAEFLRAFLSSAGTAIVAIVLLATAASALAGRPLIRDLIFRLMGRADWLRDRVGTASEAAGDQYGQWRERRAARKEIERAARHESGEAPIPDVFRDEIEAAPAVREIDARLPDDALSAEPLSGDEDDDATSLLEIPPPPIPAIFAEEMGVELPTAAAATAPEPAAAVATPKGFPTGTSLRPDDFHIPTAVRNARRRASRAAIEAACEDDDTPVLPTRRASPAAIAAARTAAEPMAAAPEPAAEPVKSASSEDARPARLGETPNARPGTSFGPRIVATEAVEGTPRVRLEPPAEQGRLAIDDKKTWRMPRINVLDEIPEREIELDHDVLTANAMTLLEKLADFKVDGSVEEIRPGPVVTTYEFKPAKGVRVNQITKLRDDLTMSLSAENVRVVAPIPGKDVVGIEVPNEQRQIVYFREVVESAVWSKSKSPLTIVLGKDIEGKPVVADLAKAPHLLVAGATGQGKSVGVNSFICSMLFKASPEDVKFIFIDPKVIELSIYEGIPHLLLPVLSDPDKATLALKWAVREMERRYAILHDAQVRNIDGYRAKLPKLKLQAKTKKVRVRNGKKELVDMHEPGADILDHPPEPEHLPKIVVVIDEFADLILNTGKDVETAVSRLAAKARACGIHIVLATQRPDTKVITGTIKANFPSRVAFKVSTMVDSKVVLDQPGAETLLGRGDMLFWPAGKDIVRCHGTWVKDDEVIAIAEHWRKQGEPSYDLEILKDPEAEDIEVIADEDLDNVFWDAVQIAIDAQQASVSFLQRKLKIGYQRSARIIDQMEARGIVGPSTGANRPREIIDNNPPMPSSVRLMDDPLPN